jgi:hypothetical protein
MKPSPHTAVEDAELAQRGAREAVFHTTVRGAAIASHVVAVVTGLEQLEQRIAAQLYLDTRLAGLTNVAALDYAAIAGAAIAVLAIAVVAGFIGSRLKSAQSGGGGAL